MAWKYGDGGDVPAWWGRNRKIEALVPLARLAASKWAGSLRAHSMTFDDIVGAAMVGVIYAVDHYDPARGRQLVGYAAMCVHSAICNEADRYNLTRPAARAKREYVTWEVLAECGDGGHDDDGLPRVNMADPHADTEGDALAGVEAAAAWEDWTTALSPLERHVAEIVIAHAGVSVADPYGGYFGGAPAATGLPKKVIMNACERLRKKLRGAAERQGIDIAAASAEELLAMRLRDEDKLQPRRTGPRPQRTVTAFGETKFVREWTRDPRCAVSAATLTHRLSHGIAAEEAIVTPPDRDPAARFGKNR